MLGSLLAFEDERRTQIRGASRLWCWLRVAAVAWAALAVGWLWALISVALEFQVPSSGAVLVCATVLTEVSFERMSYRHWPRGERHDSAMFRLVEDDERRLGLSRDDMLIIGKEDGFSGVVKALLGISNDQDWIAQGYITGTPKSGAFWRYGLTIVRVERMVTTAVVISLIGGTLVWAYAHCVYESCAGPA